MSCRAALAGALLGAVLLADRAAPAAADGVSLQLQGAERPVVVTSAQIEALADVPATAYRVRDEAGRRARTLRLSGTRLATVLRAAGVDPAALPTLEITRDDGTILYLSRNQIDPGAGAPPLLYVRGRSVGFARDSGGRDDVNGPDLFTSSSGTPIRVTVSPTAVLSVRVTTGRDRIEPGGRVRFEATVEGQLPGEALDYEWRFGNGRTAAGVGGAVHRFARRGRYEVVLRVTGDQGSGGSSAPVLVQVGAPVRAGAGTGSGSERGVAPMNGAADGSGGTPPGPAQPGRGAGARRAAERRAAERRAADRRAADRRAAERRAAGRRAGERRAGERRQTVRGVLLGAAGSAAAAPLRASAGTVAARAGSPDRDSALAGLAGAGACALLLAAGAAVELRAGARLRRRVLGAPR